MYGASDMSKSGKIIAMMVCNNLAVIAMSHHHIYADCMYTLPCLWNGAGCSTRYQAIQIVCIHCHVYGSEQAGAHVIKQIIGEEHKLCIVGCDWLTLTYAELPFMFVFNNSISCLLYLVTVCI